MAEQSILKVLAAPVSVVPAKASKKLFETDVSYDLIEHALEIRCGKLDEMGKPPTKFHALLALMRDKERGVNGSLEQSDLSPLMRRADVTMFDVFRLIEEWHTSVHGVIKAKVRAANAEKTMDSFFDDVSDAAIGKLTDCPDCIGGKTTVPGTDLPMQCTRCFGTAKIKLSADPKARDAYIKMHGLDEKGGAQTNINVATQVGVKVERDAEPSILKRVQGYIDE